MLKIKEGMFVRTKYEILKLRKENENGWFFDGEMMIIKPDNIDKYIIDASYNIIDLVEVGDYVNGNKVIRIETSSYPEDKNVKIIVCCGDDDYYSYYNEDIKTILTKEVFKANEYRMETD